jgi:predicted aminopeptidase
LKTTQTGLAAYDDWMSQPLNNAKISGVVAYHDFVPAFSVILAEKNGDLGQFYERCRQLAQTQKGERDRILRDAMQRAPETAMNAYHAFQLDK